MERHNLKIPCRCFPFVCEADYSVANFPHIHCDRVADFNIAIYLIKGEIEVIEDEITYTLKAGDLFFLKSNVRHYGVKPFEIGSAWFYAHFYLDEITDNMGGIKESFDFPVAMQTDSGLLFILLWILNL